MNKIQVLAKNRNTFFIKRLTEEVGEVTFIHPLDELTPPSCLVPLVVRTTSAYRNDEDLNWLREASICPINSLESLLLCRSKCAQYDFFQRASIPCLPWVDLQQASHGMLEDFLHHHGPSTLIKPHRGQGGWGIEVFQNKELLQWHERRARDSGDLEFVLQPYIEDAVECRLFFIGEDFKLTLQRKKAPQGVAANFSREGDAHVTGNLKELDAILDKFRQHYSLFYGAMDVLLTKDGPVVLEMNAVPGIEQLEAVSGLNIIRQWCQRLT